MSTSAGASGSTGQSVAATFLNEQAANRAVDDLKAKGVPQERVKVVPKEQDRAVAYAEMRDEMEGVAASPGIGAAMTGSMAKGSIMGTVIFTVIGVAAGLLLGWVWGGTASKLAIAAVCGGFAGATFGFTAGGFLKPRLRPDPKDKGEFEDEPVAQPLGPSGTTRGEYVVEVQTESDEEFEKVHSALEQLGPLRLDRFTSHGEVLATPNAPGGKSDSAGTPPGRG